MVEPRMGGLAGRVNDGNVKWFTLIASCFALFMAILDNLVVNIAMPTIARDLDASTTQLQWIVSAYTLIFASLQITAGGLGDRRGGVRAAVVHHHDVGLGQAPAQLRQRAGQALLLVEGGYDDQHAPGRAGQRHRRTAFQ